MILLSLLSLATEMPEKMNGFTSAMVLNHLYQDLVLRSCITLLAAFILSSCHLSLSFLKHYNFKTRIVQAVNTFDELSLLLKINLRIWQWKTPSPSTVCINNILLYR